MHVYRFQFKCLCLSNFYLLRRYICFVPLCHFSMQIKFIEGGNEGKLLVILLWK